MKPIVYPVIYVPGIKVVLPVIIFSYAQKITENY